MSLYLSLETKPAFPQRIDITNKKLCKNVFKYVFYISFIRVLEFCLSLTK
jgi:hypothetical protein